MSTVTNRFQSKVAEKALHAIVDDARMKDLFKMLEAEGVILTVKESEEKLLA